jgi:hypothetical protein
MVLGHRLAHSLLLFEYDQLFTKAADVAVLPSIFRTQQTNEQTAATTTNNYCHILTTAINNRRDHLTMQVILINKQ